MRVPGVRAYVWVVPADSPGSNLPLHVRICINWPAGVCQWQATGWAKRAAPLAPASFGDPTEMERAGARKQKHTHSHAHTERRGRGGRRKREIGGQPTGRDGLSNQREPGVTNRRERTPGYERIPSLAIGRAE